MPWMDDFATAKNDFPSHAAGTLPNMGERLFEVNTHALASIIAHLM